MCVLHFKSLQQPVREFIFRDEQGLVTCLRDLSDSFGQFHAATGQFKRSFQHPCGQLCTLYENAESADDNGSHILWGGAAAAALLLCGSSAFEESVREGHCARQHALAAVRAALAAAATPGAGFLELGAGHGLPTALASLSGCTALGSDLPAAVPALAGSLAGMLGLQLPADAAGMACSLPWGDAAAVLSAVDQLKARGAPLRCVLACDVLYRAAHVKLLATTVEQLCAASAAQQEHPPDVVFIIDPDCVPGCEALLHALQLELQGALEASHAVALGACSDNAEKQGCAVLLLCATAMDRPT